MSQSAIKKGITTIVWGSDGFYPKAAAIIESMACKPMNLKAHVENNIGNDVVTIVASNGFDATVKALYDSAIVWPAVGDTLLLITPILTAGVNCLVMSVGEDVARKKEATITIDLEYRPDLGL